MTNELSILIETLQKKEEVLRKILERSMEQLDLVKNDSFDEVEFDRLFDAKDGLIDELNRLDEGFDSVYNNIRNEIKENLPEYKPQIASLQQLIKVTIDLGSEIHLTENKVKDALPKAIAGRKKELNNKKATINGVTSYYRASKMMNIQDPYFMDHKQ